MMYIYGGRWCPTCKAYRVMMFRASENIKRVEIICSSCLEYTKQANSISGYIENINDHKESDEFFDLIRNIIEC